MRLILLLISFVYYCYAAVLPEESCELEGLGYFITPKEVLGEQAKTSCEELGGQLADITSRNMPMVSGAIARCFGPSTRTRIQTWDKNSFGTPELIMTSGAAFGTVHVGTNGEPVYALCLRSVELPSRRPVEGKVL
jgi:hypothetical protein